jgi:hypothetical protein
MEQLHYLKQSFTRRYGDTCPVLRTAQGQVDPVRGDWVLPSIHQQFIVSLPRVNYGYEASGFMPDAPHFTLKEKPCLTTSVVVIFV